PRPSIDTMLDLGIPGPYMDLDQGGDSTKFLMDLAASQKAAQACFLNGFEGLLDDDYTQPKREVR
uniref:COP9 signalosome complex subunit 9 n=1 Tax=Peromyscus maniculatus bairdii TaxID=230844 RepID=A0A8C8W4X7_PERMB